MKYYVYILQSTTIGSYYVGHTDNLTERVRKHNSGQVKFTKPEKHCELRYFETFAKRGEAVIREREIKGRKKRAYIESLILRGVAQLG